MNKNLKTYFNLLWQSIVFWFLTFFLFFIIRYSGLKTNLELKDPTYIFTIADKVTYALIMGGVIGFIFSFIEFLFQKYLSKKLVIAVQLLLKVFIYLTSLILLFTFIRWFFQYDKGMEVAVSETGWWKSNTSFWVGVIVFILATLNFSFLKIALEKFGKKNFFNILIGRYNKPREEKRIFMFLDLKNSTGIAEKLGHLSYSHFIQECLFDLNEVILDYDAEIYQYVGDEAVITWTYKKGIKHNNCIEVYRAFKHQLKRKEAYYIKTFGLTPQFKAGVHGGTLTVVEVGSIKKEIAYHGDVINTAARIQSMCNTYKESLLISESLRDELKLESGIQIKELGYLPLKGKQQKINLFGLDV